jgi:hypothetical protein
VVSHEKAATATLTEARKKGAHISPSMREGILGVARAWDEAEAVGELRFIAALARQMLEWVQAVQGLIPAERPIDAFNEISQHLSSRQRGVKRA